MDENRFWILSSKKLAGEISAEEILELELLLIHHPQFKDIVDHLRFPNPGHPPLSASRRETVLRNLRNKISELQPDTSTATNHHTGEIVQEAPQGFWYGYKKSLILSSLLVLLLSVFIFTKQKKGALRLKDVSRNSIATKPGSRSQVRLPDGTLVILNADSKLTYPDNFLGDTREVTLEGEAYFEVTENKLKPFIIHSKLMDIKVLGTVFNVKAYPGETLSEASLLRGSIEVTLNNRRNEKIMLKPNEKISVSGGYDAAANDAGAAKSVSAGSLPDKPLISLAPLSPDLKEHIVKEIGWTQNKLMFSNETLEDIAVILQRWYGTGVEIRSDKLKGQKFTGNFVNENLQQIIEALQVAYNFDVRKESNAFIIY